MGNIRNLLAGLIISVIMFLFFFSPETSLTPAVFVSNRHFRKKWTSGKPSSQTSGYLFIYNHWVQIFKFLSNLLYVETNGNGTNCLDSS